MQIPNVINWKIFIIGIKMQIPQNKSLQILNIANKIDISVMHICMVVAPEICSKFL